MNFRATRSWNETHFIPEAPSPKAATVWKAEIFVPLSHTQRYVCERLSKKKKIKKKIEKKWERERKRFISLVFGPLSGGSYSCIPTKGGHCRSEARPLLCFWTNKSFFFPFISCLNCDPISWTFVYDRSQHFIPKSGGFHVKFMSVMIFFWSIWKSILVSEVVKQVIIYLPFTWLSFALGVRLTRLSHFIGHQILLQIHAKLWIIFKRDTLGVWLNLLNPIISKITN